MRLLPLIIVLASMALANLAHAGDILRIPEAGEYRFHAQAAEAAAGTFDPADLSGTAEICAFYGDTELACWPVDANGEVNELLTVLNEGADKRIRGRAKDASGNTSADSADAYLIDFTAPGVPVLVGRYFLGANEGAEDIS